MEWKDLLSRQRYRGKTLERSEEGRSLFQKDIDRIIFSSAFRLLKKLLKTKYLVILESYNWK
jgi:dGTPase